MMRKARLVLNMIVVSSSDDLMRDQIHKMVAVGYTSTPEGLAMYAGLRPDPRWDPQFYINH